MTGASLRKPGTDFAGKIVVLEFWATWCGPCQARMAEIQTYPKRYPEWNGNVVLVAASVDDAKDAVIKHLKAQGWNQSHNVWIGTEATKSYQIDAVPTAFVIDRKGLILAVNPADIVETVNRELNKVADR
jgi:thiol-disulfide isomerase/thioredoxin